ncbi:phage integrase SAM-like domain-containing protein [Elizabethkingia anophelis]|uniref:phage integrase SAM-like domain-containing protein n=1 Tax=Elizabethkingia anophelis TaxID=1117645 RepID=UPI0032098CD6
MSQYISNRKEFISHSTYKRYIVFFNLIQRFEGHVMKRLFIQDVTIEFIKKFITFGKEELYSENTIYRTIHFVKTILNFVEKKGIRTPVRELDIKREKQQKDIISLDEYEIIKIKKAKIPSKYTPSKEWLIISCYTGQRFSDFIRFSHDQLINIKGKICLKFTQQKTKKKC